MSQDVLGKQGQLRKGAATDPVQLYSRELQGGEWTLCCLRFCFAASALPPFGGVSTVKARIAFKGAMAVAVFNRGGTNATKVCRRRRRRHYQP